MQIIIPMTGHGSRFKAANYQRLKPFIHVHGLPMVEWVVKMFPNDADKITFICQQDHLDELDYVSLELKRIAPKAAIFAIKDWVKQGPVNDILRAAHIVDDQQPVLISYCDYYMHWDYATFKTKVAENGCAGAVPCYSGFHPHLIPKKNLYACCKVDADENLIEIREKFSWEKDKTKARYSPGVYYFKTGTIMKKYCQAMVDAADHILGEYYASHPYNYLVQDKLKVWCPINVQYFCQWGTPEDLAEYWFWVSAVQGFK